MRTSIVNPFIFIVTARVCRCEMEPVVHQTGKTIDPVIATAQAFWWAYLGFYGDVVGGLEFAVVDIRDGTVWWRNGHRIKGVESGVIPGSEDQPAGRGSPVGEARRQWPRPAGRAGRRGGG